MLCPPAVNVPKFGIFWAFKCLLFRHLGAQVYLIEVHGPVGSQGGGGDSSSSSLTYQMLQSLRILGFFESPKPQALSPSEGKSP